MTLSLNCCFNADETARLKAGLVPADMDDRWFVFFEAEWLYLHRSWTGSCIFGVRLQEELLDDLLEQQHGVRVAQAWASREWDEYQSKSVEDDTRMLDKLLSALAAGQLGPSSGPRFIIHKAKK